jgi:hypothetical protein
MTQGKDIEIPEDMLESISGGVVDDLSRENPQRIGAIFKRLGSSFDERLEYLKSFSNWNEMLQILTDSYNAA